VPNPADTDRYSGVWTGREFIVYAVRWAGGIAGAAYNPRTNRWRRLPGNEYAHDNFGAKAVWTGTEMLTFGASATAYNPDTNSWRPLSTSPIFDPSVAAWTGRVVLLWGAPSSLPMSGLVAYDPARDAWEQLPKGPLYVPSTMGVWTGRELILVGGGDGSGQAFAAAAAYNPTTRAWRSLPSLPTPRTDATVTWTGSDVIVLGGRSGPTVVYSDALAYRPGSTVWRHLLDMPIGRFGHETVWTGRELLVWGGGSPPYRGGTNTYTAPPSGLAYRPGAESWAVLPASPVRARYRATCAWTGGALLIWSGTTVAYPEEGLVDGAALTLK